MKWLLVICAVAACKKQEGKPDPMAKHDAGAVTIDGMAPVVDAGAAKPAVKAVKVAVGQHTSCVLISDGTVRCWGKNDAGQLGIGTTEDSAKPVALPLRGVKDIVLGAAHACALLDDSSVTCWGRINVGKPDDALAPFAPGVAKASRIFAVRDAACATLDDEELVCWGDVDAKGHVRIAAKRESRAPTPAADLKGATEIAAAGDDICVLRADGRVACLAAKPHCTKAAPPPPKAKAKGKGKAAKRGAPKPAKPAEKPEPGLEVLPLPAAKHLAFGAGLCVIAKADGVQCLAKDGCTAESPWPGLGTVAAVDGACARLSAGSVRCWANKERALKAVPGVKSASAIAASSTHGCAVLSNNTVVCWGSNKHGALGRGNADDGNYPEASAIAL